MKKPIENQLITEEQSEKLSKLVARLSVDLNDFNNQAFAITQLTNLLYDLQVCKNQLNALGYETSLHGGVK